MTKYRNEDDSGSEPEVGVLPPENVEEADVEFRDFDEIDVEEDPNYVPEEPDWTDPGPDEEPEPEGDQPRALASRYTRYTAAQATARAKSYTTYRIGYCLNFCWVCVDYPNSAGLASANAAWAASQQKVYSGTPPAGALVYWGGGRYGHIAVSVGGGYVRSTDYPSKGRVGTVSISYLTRAWGLTYRGWSRDYAGVRIAGLQVTSYPGTMSVDLKTAIYAKNLRPGARNADVSRFEKALWNYLGGAYRQKIYGSRGAVGDGYYGTLTSQMCSDAYYRFNKTRFTYPGGTALLKALGFTNAR